MGNGKCGDGGLPDGKSLLALSDETGEMEFWQLPAGDRGERKPLTSGGKVFRFGAAVAPVMDTAQFALVGQPMFAVQEIPGLYVVGLIKFSIQISTKDGTTYGLLISSSPRCRYQPAPRRPRSDRERARGR